MILKVIRGAFNVVYCSFKSMDVPAFLIHMDFFSVAREKCHSVTFYPISSSVRNAHNAKNI